MNGLSRCGPIHKVPFRSANELVNNLLCFSGGLEGRRLNDWWRFGVAKVEDNQYIGLIERINSWGSHDKLSAQTDRSLDRRVFDPGIERAADIACR